MRVVVNQLAAGGRRTGIGHYTLQLLRCLREQAAAGEVATFPPPWLERVPEFLARCRSRVDPGDGGAPQQGSRPLPLAGLRRGALRLRPQVNRSLWGQAFRAACSREGYDLYHEPNFIPFACDRPTVATVHDLSVLRHPEWHPADRVAHFERHFRRGVARCAHFLAISEFG